MEAEMACPIDGTPYITIGDQKVCPKCGHVAGYKQIDIVKVLQENEELKRKLRELEGGSGICNVPEVS